MNKEITIYELLGLVKDNKAPKKIKCNDLIFIYNEPSKDYVYERSNGCWLFTDYIDIGKNISKKVEILEEDKDIEEIKIDGDFGGKYITNEQGANCYIKSHDETMINKLNEVIREVNKLKKDKKGE